MAKGSWFFIILFIISMLENMINSLELDRHSFPDDFIFGTAASAFQYEGATSEGGKSPTIWDHFSLTYPERTKMHNADVAIDFYHRYKDDIKLMKELNMDAFRFSISWSRLIPSGKLKDGVNKEGVQFYKDLIDELLANDIQPSMTLYHWDHPQSLEDEYGGFLSPKIVEDFRDFARICFEEFGDKVKMWTTINEPYIMTVAGYDQGNKAAGRCSKWVNEKCQAGDSSTEPYIVSHHTLLAHAAAVEEFRKCEKTSHDGQIGIVLSPRWFEPYHSDSTDDKEAAERALAFEIGWHLDPVIHGDYPEIVKKYAGNKLPSFTVEQSKMLQNSSDFVGINYYTARFAAHLPHIDPEKPRFKTDHHVEWKLTNHSGHIIGPGEERGFLFSHPEGLRKVLNYIKERYNNMPVYIKENGINDNDDGTKPREEIVKDTFRIEYHKTHFEELHKAIVEDGCDVRGYYAWSLMDNFEWEHGYTARFGLYYVDFVNGLKRYPKDSVKWFKRFLKKSVVGESNKEEVEEMSRAEGNKTFKGFEESAGFFASFMAMNQSRRDEENNRCSFDFPHTHFGVLQGIENPSSFY
ncbi:Beta-glucosidase 30 [Arabidopsis thaliana]|jgi:beta-glucosidase|uniref:Beta-glucosidase 30 n=3 Tax=Arabidopsis TaxID=3701 RepID=BGL30_ARATH|nr:Glycosyl hydrolase superfamily protein [Arabidopsis thaliana]Q9M1C9.1 RecName: Full=Beta-glucosidase 30; Short=AtBGLU30; AltName: Full=Protein DARK INDUCIBLE 2; AltName: Full=Protein SENESCENCE-RELATED GENE 2; Flags: Precursor [Arabidopsis thaliana]KAG7629156.1 Glycoside hydrolase family 1 [Arabidopsis thaliana x Arabidopsis arenosa]AEE80017.1 Glycosyl hydrolase superfamily protein [Arabidopsis thaliana]CAB75929.1 beta-glucosidase-like protein [Arabidopsis thaliana]VYS60959.1 unnamed protei|eukprot:NP_191573.1 Glycosyl hydrolase superfamily protein [Arabidopsis thaliana]